jgi:hypothetical protein
LSGSLFRLENRRKKKGKEKEKGENVGWAKEIRATPRQRSKGIAKRQNAEGCVSKTERAMVYEPRADNNLLEMGIDTIDLLEMVDSCRI